MKATDFANILLDRLLESDRSAQRLKAELGIEAEFDGVAARMKQQMASVAYDVPPGCALEAELEGLRADKARLLNAVAELEQQFVDTDQLLARAEARAASLATENAGLIDSLAARQAEADELQLLLASATQARDSLIWQAETVAMKLVDTPPAIIIENTIVQDPVVAPLAPAAVMADAVPLPEFAPPSPGEAGEFNRLTGGGIMSPELEPFSGDAGRPEHAPSVEPQPEAMAPAVTLSPPQGIQGQAGRHMLHPVIWDDARYGDLVKTMWERGDRLEDITGALNAIIPPDKAPFKDGQVRSRVNNCKLKRPSGFVRNPNAGGAEAQKFTARAQEMASTAVAVVAQPAAPRSLSPIADRHGDRVQELTDECHNPDEIAKILNHGLKSNDRLNAAMVKRIQVEMRAFAKGQG